jgi:hypothetical protein
LIAFPKPRGKNMDKEKIEGVEKEGIFNLILKGMPQNVK